MEFTKKDIQAVYDEVESRVQTAIKNGYLTAEDGYIYPETVKEYREAVLQGVYSTLMVLCDTWPVVGWMCGEEEVNRGWNKI